MAIELGDAVLMIRADISALQASLHAAENTTQTAMQRMASQGRTVGIALAGAGTAITGAFAMSVKSAMDFHNTMGMVNTLGVQNLQALGDKVREISVAFGLDLQNATLATYDVLSRGATELQAPEILKQAAVSAVAGMTDLKTAIEAGMSVTTAYGMSMESIGTTFDTLNVGVKFGAMTFEDLATSIGRVAPLASSAGVSMEELVSAVAATTLGGLGANEAITGLKAAISNIIKPSQEAAELASAMGINMSASTLQSQGLMGTLKGIGDELRQSNSAFFASRVAMEEQLAGLQALEHPTASQKAQMAELKKSIKELNDVQQSELGTLAKLFGSIEGLNVVLALSGGQADDFANIMEAMGQKTGVSQQMFEQFKNGNPQFTFDQLKASVEDLSIEIGDALLPALGEIFERVRPVIESMTQWMNNNPALTATILQIAGALGILAVPLGLVAMALNTLISLWGLLQGAITLVAGVIGGVSIAFISAFAAMVAGLAMAYNNWTEIWNGALLWIDDIKNAFIGIGELFMAVITGNWTAALNIAKDGLQKLADMLKAVWDMIWGIPGAIGENVMGLIPGMATGGHVKKGQEIAYGEQGPEIYAPNNQTPRLIGLDGPGVGKVPRDGGIIPNSQTHSLIKNAPSLTGATGFEAQMAYREYAGGILNQYGAQGGLWAKMNVMAPFMAEMLGLKGFAKGGRASRSGLALVGERGPEIVSLAKGDRVFSNRESSQMAGAGNVANIGTMINVENINANDRKQADAVLNVIDRKLRTSLSQAGLQPRLGRA